MSQPWRYMEVSGQRNVPAALLPEKNLCPLKWSRVYHRFGMDVFGDEKISSDRDSNSVASSPGFESWSEEVFSKLKK